MNNFLWESDYEIRFMEGHYKSGGIHLKRNWHGERCTFELINSTSESVRIKEVVLYQGHMPFSPDIEIYGEGYSKLSQYGGTIEDPKDFGKHSDRAHYKLPVRQGLFTVYNMLMFFPQQEETVLLGFASCRRYSGELRFSAKYFEIVLDFEGLELNPGEINPLEEFCFFTGNQVNQITALFAERIAANHPKIQWSEIPTGWCSWYFYGPRVTQEDIRSNLAAIKKKVPELKYIQIDEGYAQSEGDWLIPGKNFPDGVDKLCLEIKEMGFEPAMWVAPFMAEQNSRVVKEHPEWFVQDEDGTPLLSNKYSFGGWYHGPWYMLDGTHPGAQEYLRTVFRTMRREWQVKYFKMDANMWGAMPFGKRYDKNATRVDAYRAGMKAIREGAGEDSFLLGCNAPMWPSLGTVHGMRLSNDIHRSFSSFKNIAYQMISRNWQQGKLWINDPDCIVLENIEKEQLGPDGKMIKTNSNLTEDEFMFHIAAIFATGGMVLSGDNITVMQSRNAEQLKRLLPALGVAAAFDDRTFSIGRTQLGNKQFITVLNWEEAAKDISIPFNGVYRVVNYFTRQIVNEGCSKLVLKDFKAHSGNVFECIEV